ncbi:competence/damage-inducible protein A [Caldisalinibacter kiritimatiensis]|uniref:Putative competence-damage inducible protein n=1 Tax=Caldisalinibacter kiritimatiensis TaxID=1304284 RepID=R1CG04_9FIRM|nr:competence/damage-inducible protein A [Caldisalinibacter kiritimatiensis]EOD01245.1 Protein Implicated in DNA repair function with RecA and MutS [Caldisalinibacter kiritimatiensis]
MICEVINVGSELLSGDVLNTNIIYLSKKLLELGIEVSFQTTVGDNKNDLAKVITEGLKRSELLIITGGLGPTEDDITKEVVCEVLKEELVFSEEVLSKIKEHFNKCCKHMSKNNLKQAYIPKKSKVIQNKVGTAPGFIIEKDKNIIIILPGPPREIKEMFKNYICSYLSKKSNIVVKSKTIRTIGIGESHIESKIRSKIGFKDNTLVATYAKEGQVDIKITAKGLDNESVDKTIQETVDTLMPEIKKYVYSFDDESIEEVVFKQLLKNNFKIGFCESCTGGLITSRLTRISGASKILKRSIITYSNTSKIEEVGVQRETLNKYGAVSEQTAIEMAQGLKNKDNIDIAVSVTGIAGPTGGTSEKPVGLVYMALVTNDTIKCYKFNFSGSREIIQNKTANSVFNEIRKYLIDLKNY